MSKKTVNQKNVIPAIVKEEKKAIEINLDNYASALENVNVKEKKSREQLYIYPETFSPSDINSDKGKGWRGKQRNRIVSFCNNILTFAKTKQSEKLNEEIAKFKDYYHSTYSLNDYSVNSISRSNKDNIVLDLTLQIVKETI